MKHNGITLGADSPLLTAAGAKRLLQPKEEDMQIALMELLVGPARKGKPRDPTGGMILKYPDLYLLHAIPNGGARAGRTAGRMKAQGVLASMPDLCLPVMRGPFIGLYVELKVPGNRSTPEQRQMAYQLSLRGHAVIEAQSVEQGRDVILGYLALPPNRPSVRALGGVTGPLGEALARWRVVELENLTPNRQNP